VQGAEADGLELAHDAGDFAGFATQAPLTGQAGADPVGQEAGAHMINDAFGRTMEDGADLEVALEFAKGFFDFEGLKVDFTAHAAIKNEDCVWDLKAAAKDFDSASQLAGVGAVASQNGDVERCAVGVGGDG
jgi:hypothetical protein